jgi:hypothetical protein
MVATEAAPQVVVMAAQEPGTKTVRIDAETATKLLTVASIKAQMGKRFKTVEFLNRLLKKPIDELYDATLAEFDEFRGIVPKSKKPPKA